MAVPAAPVPVGTPGDNTATITWPDVTADPVVDVYEFKVNNKGVWQVCVSPLALTGLANGTAYTVAVRAVNADGAGASGTVVVTPADTDATNDNGFDDARWSANPGAVVPHLDYNDPDD